MRAAMSRPAGVDVGGVRYTLEGSSSGVYGVDQSGVYPPGQQAGMPLGQLAGMVIPA